MGRMEIFVCPESLSSSTVLFSKRKLVLMIFKDDLKDEVFRLFKLNVRSYPQNPGKSYIVLHKLQVQGRLQPRMLLFYLFLSLNKLENYGYSAILLENPRFSTVLLPAVLSAHQKCVHIFLRLKEYF